MSKGPVRMALRGERQVGDPFPTFANIRKGAPKIDRVDGASGRGYQVVGPNLKHFRFTAFNETNERLVAFIKSLGDEPNHIPFYFPARAIDNNFMFRNEGYRGSVMIHRCMPDESRLVLTDLNPKTFAQRVKQGKSVETGQPVQCECPEQPLYLDGKQKPVNCSPVVRMRIMIPGQGEIGEPGCFQVLSTSAYDGIYLTRQLEGFYELLTMNAQMEANGLRGVPFYLNRSMRPIKYRDDSGKLISREESLLWLEIDPKFGATLLDRMVQETLAAVKDQPVLMPASIADELPEGGGHTDNEELLSIVSGSTDSADSAPDLDLTTPPAEPQQTKPPTTQAVAVRSPQPPPVETAYAADDLPGNGQGFLDWLKEKKFKGEWVVKVLGMDAKKYQRELQVDWRTIAQILVDAKAKEATTPK